MLANWGSQAISFIQKAGTVAILFFGARLVIVGDLTVGELVAFNMLAGQVSGPVLRLAQLAQDFQQARISVSLLNNVIFLAVPNILIGFVVISQLHSDSRNQSVVFSQSYSVSSIQTVVFSQT